jgi:hypothetical protein
VLCLYCGKSSWRPFRKRAGGEFCSAAHRESYNERLRKVAGQLAEYTIVPPESERVAAGPVPAAAAQPEPGVPVASERFSILSFLPSQKPGETRMAPAVPSTFETSARIKRWGLKMRFLKSEDKAPAA